jgi:hypothetical protein
VTQAPETWADRFDEPPVDVEATYHRLLETMAPEARRDLGRLLLEIKENGAAVG